VAKNEETNGPAKTSPLQRVISVSLVTPRVRMKKGRKGTTRFIPIIARNCVPQRI
jgi:hypothetical protein